MGPGPVPKPSALLTHTLGALGSQLRRGPALAAASIWGLAWEAHTPGPCVLFSIIQLCEARSSSWSPVWVAGTLVLEATPAASQAAHEQSRAWIQPLPHGCRHPTTGSTTCPLPGLQHARWREPSQTPPMRPEGHETDTRGETGGACPSAREGCLLQASCSKMKEQTLLESQQQQLNAVPGRHPHAVPRAASFP